VKKEDKKLVAVAGVGGVIASLCCLGPVVLVLLGLSGVSTALAIGKFTWLFSSLAIVLFVGAIWYYLKQKKCCDMKGLQQNWKMIAIAFVTLAILLIALKYWLAPLLATIAYR
jgi:hypothetical protein